MTVRTAPPVAAPPGSAETADQAAPTELAGAGLAPLCDAPGTYVFDR